MVKYFLLFGIFFIAGCDFGYHDCYIVFPEGKVKGNTFVMEDADKTLVVDIVRAAILRNQGKGGVVFKDYTKYVGDPDVLALYVYRQSREINMSVAVYIHRETIVVDLSAMNVGSFYPVINGRISSDLKEYCKAARTSKNYSNRKLEEKAAGIIYPKDGECPAGEDIEAPFPLSGH